MSRFDEPECRGGSGRGRSGDFSPLSLESVVAFSRRAASTADMFDTSVTLGALNRASRYLGYKTA